MPFDLNDADDQPRPHDLDDLSDGLAATHPPGTLPDGLSSSSWVQWSVRRSATVPPITSP